MPSLKDLTGQKFNRLLALRRVANSVRGKVRWECVCDCGKQIEVLSALLQNGGTRSCGCLNLERIIERNTRHGACTRSAKWSEYEIWQGMMKRCRNPHANQYQDYGGRGIKVATEFLTFQGFINYMGKRPPGMTLERINNNGDYSPSNCRWASRKEQSRNSRHNHLITIGDKTQPMSAWCEENRIRPGTASMRIHQYGWPETDAVTIPARGRA